MNIMSKNLWKDFLFIVFGTTLLASAINVFYTPNQLVVGGFTGLGIIVESYTKSLFGYGVSVSTTNLVLNLPLFLASYLLLGKKMLGRTIFSTIFLSIALIYTKIFPVFIGDIMLAAVYGGVLSGIGIGFVFKGLSTTGGVDLAATILHKFYNHISVSKMMFVMDSFIIVLGLFVFGIHKAMYAIIAVYISSKCIETILEGMSFSKAAFIISDQSDEIARLLLNKLNRGVTALHGKGMYTSDEKEILLCVFSNREITTVKELVHNIDKNAFLMVTDFREVLGEGFQSIS